MLKSSINIIKILLVLALVVFLFVFAGKRNTSRNLSKLKINFIGNHNLFISKESVNKLLIQKTKPVTSVPKEILDLNELETRLNANDMVKSADVYLSINSELEADVAQRKPIARVSTDHSFYIDDKGEYMPLSKIYSARVPLVKGLVTKDKLDNVFAVAKIIYSDEFLKKNIVEIIQDEDQNIQLKMRSNDFLVNIGGLNNLHTKMNNLKAFYQKAYKDKALKIYSKVNLQFDNQVVCTKKINNENE